MNQYDNFETHSSIEPRKIREMVYVLSVEDLLELRNAIDSELLDRSIVDYDVAADKETISPSLEVPQQSAISTSISSKLEQ